MKKVRINAREVVRDIKLLASDHELIGKYNLSPRSLAKVKIKLLEKGWITESELAGSAPEANPSQAGVNILKKGSEDSTEVELLQDLTERVALLSNLKLRHTEMRTVPTGKPIRGPDEDPTSKCPKCGKIRHSPSADTCIHCGIVFAKYEKGMKEAGVAIWY